MHDLRDLDDILVREPGDHRELDVVRLDLLGEGGGLLLRQLHALESRHNVSIIVRHRTQKSPTTYDDAPELEPHSS